MHIPLSVPKHKEQEYLENLNIVTGGSGRMMMFAGDQKVEHLNDDFFGPDIPAEVADPEHYFRIASQARIGCFATQLGLLARYGKDYPDIPYLIKLNSKTNLIKKEYKDPFSTCWYDFKHIINFKNQTGLNIVGIGYTLYVGSWYESAMFEQAARLIYEAHQEGLVTVLWIYMRGMSIKNPDDIHLNAGGAGVGVCLGTDFIKIVCPTDSRGNQDMEAYKEVVKAAGRAGIVCVGGSKQSPEKFLKNLHEQIHVAGTRGCAVGRNIYQRTLDESVRMANAISAVVMYDYSYEDAVAVFKGEKVLKTN